MMKPEIANWLSVNPLQPSTATPMARLNGTETITTMLARQPSGSKVISTKPSAMAKSWPNWLSLRAMSSLWSKPTTICTSGGNWLRYASAAFTAASRISSTLSPSFWVNVTHTARLPL